MFVFSKPRMVLKTGIIYVILPVLFLLVLVGCSKEQDKAVTFWVLAGTNRGEAFSRNSLGGYATTGELVTKHRLPKYHIGSLVQDSRGRLWLGQAWNDAESSNRLLLWENGEYVQDVEVGLEPEAGIVEFGEKMIAGCTEDGMGFSLWAVDQENLESVEVVTVEPDQHDFLILTTIAANKDYLIVAAIHDAPDSTDSSHTSIWWYDRDFTLMGNMYLGADTAVWSIVPMDDGNFLLLNNSAFVGNRPDLLVFDPAAGEIVDEVMGSGFSLRGVGEGGNIYILDRIWSSTRITAKRSVTIFAGGSVETVPLPDDFGAVDIAASDGKIYLAAWQRGANSSDGIYQLDPLTAELEQIIIHSDASSLLLIP